MSATRTERTLQCRCNPNRTPGRRYHSEDCPNHPTPAPSRAPSIKFPQDTRFGPGSLESLRLTSWVDRNHTTWVRLRGSYSIAQEIDYRTVQIDIKHPLADVLTIHVPAAFVDLAESPANVAHQLLEWALEEMDL